MSAIQKPTSWMLVGIAFLVIYLCVQIVVALPSNLSNPESLNSIKGFHDNFVNNEIYDNQNSDIGQLKLPDETIYFPWAPQQTSRMKSRADFQSTQPQKEKIIMSGPESKENVQDLKALNTVKQRDIVYNESQIRNSDPANLSNVMDVRIRGDQSKDAQYNNDGLNNLDNNDPETGDPETPVNNEPNIDGQNAIGAGHSHSNYMNIEVSGITVNAINTVEDGSAVATSNITIKPVQIIGSSSQASEKV